MTNGPTVAMLAWLPPTTAPMMSRIAIMDTKGSTGSSRRTTRGTKWLSSSPAPTGNATICRMLISIPFTSTGTSAAT